MSKRKPSKYTKEIVDYIRDACTTKTWREMVVEIEQQFGITMNKAAIQNLKGRYGIYSGWNAGCFKKGRQAKNKGKKQTEFMTPEQIAKTKATRFTKGHRPANFKGKGAMRRSKKDNYWLYKPTDESKFVAYHRYIWEKNVGKIPKGHRVVFLDGNVNNCQLKNLICVKGGIMAVMNKNKLISENPEITRTHMMITDLKITANKKRKGK